MRKIWLLGLMFLLLVFSVGMGGFGGTERISVPEPATNYYATITDQSDMTTRVEKISFDGQTAISGEVGSGHVSIDFEKIASIDFVLQDQTLKADVSFKDGKTVALVVDKDLNCYAKLPYGDFRIAAKNLRKIKMHSSRSGQ